MAKIMPLIERKKKKTSKLKKKVTKELTRNMKDLLRS